MKHSILLLITCLLLLNFQSTNAQIYVEEFDSGIPSDWFDYTEAGFDFVSWFDGEVSLFKQSDGPEIMVLGTELLDLSLYTKWEVDLYAFNLNFTSNTKPYIELGIMSDPNDISTFEPIKIEHVTNESALTYTVILGAYDQTSHLAIKMVGERSQITYVDNFKLFNDVVVANYPLSVDDLSVTPADNGELSMTIEWTNPSKEADGDPLSDLEAIEFYSGGVLIGTYDNPTIGAMESAVIAVDSAGYYTVKAIPISSGLSGYEKEAPSVWVGLDYPSLVQDLTIAVNGDDATLTWTPPIKGGNDGFYDGKVTEYLITRCDGKFITVPGNLNTFTEQLDMQGTINYRIEARNDSDIGDALTSDNVYYVSEDYLYYEDFWVDVVQSTNETPATLNQWQSESTTNFADWSYFISNFTNTDPGEISFLWSNSSVPNQTIRAISPIINTSNAQNITIQMNSYIEAGNNPFSFLIETTSDGGETWTQVHEWSVDGTLVDEVTTRVIANSDVGSENFQFSISFIGNPVYPGFTRFDNVRVFNQPSTDLKVGSFNNFMTSKPGTSIPLTAEIENNSTSVLDCNVKCTVSERFGTGNPFSMELPATAMEIGEIRTMDFGTWAGEEGEYLVEIEVIYPGGDDNPDNDIKTRELNILQLSARELVLMEDFTGTWCSYCPGAALGVKELMDNGYPIAVIGRHRADDYETTDMDDRMAQYAVEGFPTMMIDGITKLTGGHQTTSVAGLYIADINRRANTQTQAQVEVIHSVLEGSKYSVGVKIKSLSIIRNPNYQLRASIIESGIDDEWLGVPTVDEAQRYYSDHPIDLSDREDLVYFSFTLDDVLDLNNTEMVIYVQDINSNEVINTSLIDINEEIISTASNIDLKGISIYPNPAYDHLYLEFGQYFKEEFANLNVVNSIGQVVLNHDVDLAEKVTLDLSSFENGVYILDIYTQSGNRHRSKFSVMKE